MKLTVILQAEKKIIQEKLVIKNYNWNSLNLF